MKNQQIPEGATRQTSIKSLDTLKSNALNSDKARRVVAPGLMAAIKRRVRPAGGN